MNTVFIFSDQHTRSVMGCYGNGKAHTPNLDCLAKAGAVFNNAYSSCPICVPVRASMVTGQDIHQISAWDNASPYTGAYTGYGHRLRDNGVYTVAVGKLHFRNCKDDTGFVQQIIPLHVRNGTGDLYATLREKDTCKPAIGRMVKEAGYGTSPYIEYDISVTREALKVLRKQSAVGQDFHLLIGYTLPHFPYVSPKECWNLFDEKELPIPYAAFPGQWPEYQFCKELRDFAGNTKGYSVAEVKKAVHAYYGMCAFLDQQVGDVLEEIERLGIMKDTYIIYSSDHGEMLGNHGLWNKNCMYEDSVGVPLIISGPEIPEGRKVETLVSTIDFYPTLLEMSGVPLTDTDKKLPGESLLHFVQQEQANRSVLSQYHASGATSGGFMLRYKRFKYIYYVGREAILFDLESDPRELENLIGKPAWASIAEQMDWKLRKRISPEETDALARYEQEIKIRANGGREKIRNEANPVIFSKPPKVNEGGEE